MKSVPARGFETFLFFFCDCESLVDLLSVINFCEWTCSNVRQNSDYCLTIKLYRILYLTLCGTSEKKKINNSKLTYPTSSKNRENDMQDILVTTSINNLLKPLLWVSLWICFNTILDTTFMAIRQASGNISLGSRMDYWTTKSSRCHFTSRARVIEKRMIRTCFGP